MDSITRDAEILSAEIRKVFAELEQNGFIFQAATIQNTRASGDYVEALIPNQTTGRSLRFAYFPGLIHPEGLSIHIENGTGGGAVSVDEFLEYKNTNSQLIEKIILANYKGTLEKRFNGLLNAAKEVMYQHLENYLFGGEWVSIPMQWGDLK